MLFHFHLFLVFFQYFFFFFEIKGKLMVAIAQTKIVLVGKFELVTNQLQQNQTQNQDATCRIERIAKSMTSQYPFLFCKRRSSL